jgi:8-oxo-dGTP diphosphatase
MGGVAEIVSAGAVVTRKAADGTEVLLVHRPRYDDWSFPKGKLDSGEHIVTTAVREVAEETGLDIRLGPPLGTQRYLVANGAPKSKDVHYWVGRVVGGDDVSAYAPNEEIDEVAWLPIAAARKRLTYAYDRDTLGELESVRKKTYPLIVLRHARAHSRKAWRGDDRLRTLTSAGKFQAEQLVPVVCAYGVQRVVSSSSNRCFQTVSPYADVADVEVQLTDALAQEDATAKSVRGQIEALLTGKEPAVLCTHRPVLPWVFEALGIEKRRLEPGSLFVAHHRRGRVVAVEQHNVSFR